MQSYINRDGQPKFFNFTVDGRLTVWELIDLIASKLNLSPRKIKIQRMSKPYGSTQVKKPDFTPMTHCMSLHEMKVESGDEFTIMRNLNATDKVPLINLKNGQLVPDARIIFEQWFDQFSKPKEEFEDAG